MNDRITSGQIFREPADVVHVVEFQKRGLPHAHFLIILKPDSRYHSAEAYDRVVLAELPDPDMYSLVVQHMIHGPCGILDTENVCMRECRCKSRYSKYFADYTTHENGIYPLYKHRDDGTRAMVRKHVLDNRWVILYNPTLLCEFNCHINVEVACDIRAVKYLYKYIHKGQDKVQFRIAFNNIYSEIDEISYYQSARWVSPVEATWQIFGFLLHGMTPAVVLLQLHFPNYQSVQFEDEDDLKDILQDERLKRTMLTEFFKTNTFDTDAKKLDMLYRDFPKHFVWDNVGRVWKRRQRRRFTGRISTVSPTESERYFLRMTLSNVRCLTSSDDLLTYDGVFYDSFREAAHRRGLLHNDYDVSNILEEACIYGILGALRRLFATLLHYCRPANPRVLFDIYYISLAEYFSNKLDGTPMETEDVLHKVLQGIHDTLESLGRDVNQFHLVDFKYSTIEIERYTHEVAAEKSIPVPEQPSSYLPVE